MDTLKTGFIVLLLLAVLYGVYVVLNKDQTPPTAEIAWHQQQAEQELQIDIGSTTKDSAKAPDGSGKSASEPDLLATPGNDPATTKAAALGSPSAVTAELSATWESTSDGRCGSWRCGEIGQLGRVRRNTEWPETSAFSPLHSQRVIRLPIRTVAR